MGVGGFSIDGFDEFRQTDFAKNVPASSPNSTNPVTYAGGDQTGNYTFWDGNEYKQGQISANSLVSFIRNHENYDDDTHSSNTGGTLLDILKSVGGCVDFGVVKCFFYDIGSHSNRRVLSEKSSPLITDNPRRSTGGIYAYQYTQNQKRKGDVGTYVDIKSPNIDNVDLTVTAPLKVHYNENLGCFESNAPILARLVTDVDAAAVDDFKIDIDDLKDKDKGWNDGQFYAASGEYYNSSFTTGLAVPMSIKEGNPNAFGPNLISVDADSSGEPKKVIEAIRVVNRSDISFKEGLLVLCNHIDGEWIIQKFLEKEELPAQATRRLGLGNWTFWMYVASSDEFFRDGIGGSRVTPAMALENILNKWGGGTSTMTFNPYVQLSSMDFASTAFGGFNSSSYVHRCNIDVSNDSSVTNPSRLDDFDTFGVWWGASFPDGYQTMNGSFNVPADIGICGDYADSSISWTSPIENTLEIAFACNNVGALKTKLRAIVDSRITRGAIGTSVTGEGDGGDGDGDTGGGGDGGDEEETASTTGFYSYWVDSAEGTTGNCIRGLLTSTKYSYNKFF